MIIIRLNSKSITKTCFFQRLAHLAVIDSEEEYNLLYNMKKEEEQIWFGVHEIFKTGEWVTIHDAPMTVEKWVTNQPDNPGTEQCVTLRSFGMNNLSCKLLRGYYCEIKI
jgi:hypothetical protein